MKNHIEEVLQRIEDDFQVKILYACDSGSRALGVASLESDYDIRFIYVHRLEWYLSIDKGEDVIEVPKRNKLSLQVHPLLDISGWELSKALRLFRKSNPSIFEWLHSNQVYTEELSLVKELKALEKRVLAPKPFILHYVNIAKRNFNHSVIEGKKVKNYLYIFRSILASRWILRNGSAPPAGLSHLLSLLPHETIKKTVYDMVRVKQAGREQFPDDLGACNQFIREELESLELEGKKLEGTTSDSTEQLNQLFRKTLKEAWK